MGMFEKNASKSFKKQAIGIIILGCLAMYFSCCLASDALNIIEPAFTEKMGWSFSSVSVPFTIANYVLILLSFWFSTYILKNGTRKFAVAAFGALAVGTFLIGISYAGTTGMYWMYLAGAVITKFAAQMVQLVTFQLCANWFSSTRGRILGIITIASPLNSATSITLLTLGKDAIGLTACYVIIAGILLISTIMAARFAISRPEELGLTVDGISTAETSEKVDEKTEKEVYHSKWKISELLKTPETWALAIGFGIFNGTIGPIMGFFLIRMAEVGVETSMALTVISSASLIGIFLSYVFGYLDDKLGTMIAARILGVTFVIACVLFYFADASHMILIWIAAVMMASIVGGTPNLHPSSIIYVFGAREYQAANRVISIIIGVFASFGVQLMSILLDKTGSLSLGYAIFAVLCVMGTICMFMVRKSYDEG